MSEFGQENAHAGTGQFRLTTAATPPSKATLDMDELKT